MMNRRLKAGWKRITSVFLAFTIVSILILGNSGIAFAEGYDDRFYREETDLSELGDFSKAAVSNASFRNTKKDDVVISIFSEEGDYRSGGLVTLDVHLKNETGTMITDGSLTYSAKGIQEGSAEFLLLEESGEDEFDAGIPDNGILDDGAPENDMLDNETPETGMPQERDQDEGLAGEDSGESEERRESQVEIIPEDTLTDQDIPEEEDSTEGLERIEGIELVPGQIYSVRFTFAIDEDIEGVRNQQVKFQFNGKGEERRIRVRESFLYTVNYLNIDSVEFHDGNRIGTGETVTMGIHAAMFDFDAILEDSFKDVADAAPATPSVAVPIVPPATPSEALPATPSQARPDISSKPVPETPEVDQGIPQEAESQAPTEAVATEPGENETQVPTESSPADPEEQAPTEAVPADPEKTTAQASAEAAPTEATEAASTMSSEPVQEVSTETGVTEHDQREKMGFESIVKIETKSEEPVSSAQPEDKTDKTGNEVTDNDATGDDATDDGATGYDATDDDTAGDDAADDGAAGGDTIESNTIQSAPNESDPSGGRKDTAAEDARETQEDADEEESEDYTVDLGKVNYRIEMYNAKLNSFKVRKALVDDVRENMLICSFRVSGDVNPGIYFGKITQESRVKGKTCKSTQGFSLIVTGDGEISLEDQIGDAAVTVSGPVDSFPEADQLAVRVSEVEQAQMTQVDEALEKKSQEEGISIQSYKALDIKLYADGVEAEPVGPINVAFKNLELEKRDPAAASDALPDAPAAVQTLSQQEETADTSERIQSGGEEIKVYHLDETQVVANEMNSTVASDGTVVMETDHFSIYIVVNVPEVKEVPVTVEHWAQLDKMTFDSNGKIKESVSGNRLYPGAQSGSTYAKQEVKIYSDDNLTLPNGSGTGVDYSIAVSNWSKVALGGNYTVKSVTITNANYPNGQTFTENAADQKIYLAAANNKIKINYVPTLGTIKGYTGFHDYNVTVEGKTTDGNHGTLNTSKVGINNTSLGSSTTRIGVGIGGTGQAQIRHGYTGAPNKAGSVVTGIPQGTLAADNMIKFNYQDPGLFATRDITTSETYKDGKKVTYYAKKYLPNYQLGFERQGDTYTLKSVYDSSGKTLSKNLDQIVYTCNSWNGSKKLYSNLFWPLDSVSYNNAVNGKNRDPLFGYNHYGFPQNDEDVNNKGITHNWFFGMRYDFEFVLGDYTGPMDYYFRGDDDFWLYVDGNLVSDVDLGGIHSAEGSYVDLKSWMQNKGLLSDKNQKHTMSVFFIERGGTGSCCYMKFTLPSITSIPTPESETVSRTVQKLWLDGNNEDKKRPEYIYVQLKQNGASYGSAVRLEASNGWKYTWDNLPKYKEVNSDEEHVYTVEEVGTIVGYTSSVNGMTITNTRLTDINVRKQWVGGAGEGSVQVGLFKDGSKRTGDIITLDSSNNWSGVWQNLPGYDSGGSKINYVPYEVDSSGNKVEAGSTVQIGEGQYIVTYSSDHSVITNTYNQKHLTVKKVWVDYENTYHTRPEILEVQLYQNEAAYGGPVKLSDANQWTADWKNLPVKADGSSPPYVYTVRELDRTGRPIEDGSTAVLSSGYSYTASYDSSGTGTSANPFRITNTLLAAKLRIKKTVEQNGLENEPIDPTYKFVIQVLDSKGTVYTQTALGNGEESGAILVIPPEEGQIFSIAEIVPMEYTMTHMESQPAGALSETDNGDKVTVKPGDDILVILTNTPDHESYFHHTASVTNVKGFSNGEGSDFRPENPFTEYHGSDNPQYMASAFTSDCIMAFVEDKGVARGQRKLEKGDDLYG